MAAGSRDRVLHSRHAPAADMHIPAQRALDPCMEPVQPAPLHGAREPRAVPSSAVGMTIVEELRCSHPPAAFSCPHACLAMPNDSPCAFHMLPAVTQTCALTGGGPARVVEESTVLGSHHTPPVEAEQRSMVPPREVRGMQDAQNKLSGTQRYGEDRHRDPPCKHMDHTAREAAEGMPAEAADDSSHDLALPEHICTLVGETV